MKAVLALLISSALPCVALAQVKLDVTQQEATVIANALADRPFREVAPLINKLGQQLEAQARQAAPPPSVAPPAPPAPPAASAVPQHADH